MRLNQKLYDLFAAKAAAVNVEIVSIGLGYTAVTTSDGGIGLSYTYFGDKKSCMVLNEHIDYEAKPAVLLLEKIKKDYDVSAEVYGVPALTANSLINAASIYHRIENDLLL